MIKKMTALAAALLCTAALAAPKIDRVVVKPNPAQFAGDKAPEVEIAISISRTKFDKGGCDARVDFGDGEGRNLDFSAAATRTLRHVYRKDGSYSVAVRGTGATPCDGAQQTALKVAGQPKQPEPRKAEQKKPEPKKKADPKKKSEPKKKAPAKKPEKKDESK